MLKRRFPFGPLFKYPLLVAETLTACHAYVFQTYSVGQVLTAAQMNQEEVNIRDHVHGQSGVSAITGVGGGVARQTVVDGSVDTSGLPNFLSAGTGLQLNVAATTTNLSVGFAGGFSGGSPADSFSVLTADATGVLASSLLTSNTSSIYADYASTSSVTWSYTLVPCQWDRVFDRAQASLMHFDGTNASTTFIDDFGNTWAASGSAQLTTAQSKFGTASLLLNGTTDYAQSTNFTSLGSGSWEISGWFRINSLPGSGTRGTLVNAGNASNWGVWLNLFNNAGTTKLELSVSSNATSADVAAAVVGTNTTWALNQWNKYRIVFDALAGNYKVYLSLNAAAETTDITQSSSARTCLLTGVTLGATRAHASFFNGWLDEFRILRCASATAAETPKASAFAVNEANMLVCWFDTSHAIMREVTTASAAAGTNPTFTTRTRVFVGEADSSGAGVSAVRNWAYQRRYRSAVTTGLPGTSTQISATHNVGVCVPRFRSLSYICLTPDNGYSVGDEIQNMTTRDGSAEHTVLNPPTATRLAMTAGTEPTNYALAVPKGGGACVNPTQTAWGYLFECDGSQL